jgi:type IV secretion system protein VirD4
VLWLAALAPVAPLGALFCVAWPRFDAARGRERLGRRPLDPRGSKPRGWARPRDLRGLVARRPPPDRFSLGYLGRRLVVSGPNAHACLVAATQQGKTTGFVIPWLLEHEGPALVTSTKRDVYDATFSIRSRRGECYVWGPFGEGCMRWTPIDGCEDWAFALRQARWLTEALQQDNEIARYWNDRAATTCSRPSSTRPHSPENRCELCSAGSASRPRPTRC